MYRNVLSGADMELTERFIKMGVDELPVSASYILPLRKLIREIHWHSNADELQYYIQGKARMTVFKPGPKARTFNYQAGDVGYVPVGNFHYVQNIGDEKVIFLEIFKSNHFADISLAQWIAMTPKEVVKSVLNLSDAFLEHVKKESNPVVKYPGFEMPSAKGTPQNVKYFKNFNYKVKNPPCNAAKEH